MAIDTHPPSIGLSRFWNETFLSGQIQCINHILEEIVWQKLADLNMKSLEKCGPSPGIYMFVWKETHYLIPAPIKGESVVYVGKAQNLEVRLKNYVEAAEGTSNAEVRKKILVMLKHCIDDLEVWWTAVPFQYITTVEDVFIKSLDPHFNTTDRMPFDLL